MDDGAVEDRQPHPELADARGLGRQQVAVDHGDVRQLAGLDRAEAVLPAEDAGGVEVWERTASSIVSSSSGPARSPDGVTRNVAAEMVSSGR